MGNCASCKKKHTPNSDPKSPDRSNQYKIDENSIRPKLQQRDLKSYMKKDPNN